MEKGLHVEIAEKGGMVEGRGQQEHVTWDKAGQDPTLQVFPWIKNYYYIRWILSGTANFEIKKNGTAEMWCDVMRDRNKESQESVETEQEKISKWNWEQRSIISAYLILPELMMNIKSSGYLDVKNHSVVCFY